jgi:CBS domain-containing protein
MRDRKVGCLLVTHDQHPIGIITDRDLVVRVLAEGRDPNTARIADLLSYDPVTVSVDEGIESAASRMREHGIRRLPLVDEEGKVVGIVTSDDLLALLGREVAAVCAGIENPADATESR